ncbi:hypothetical protein P3W45_001404 [Vairimorpha bombi]
MAFKKFKLQKKKESEIKKTLPANKYIKVPQTHTNKPLIEIIFHLLLIKQNTGLRKILSLSYTDLNKNAYMLTTKILEVSLSENFSNDLVWKVLKKIFKDNEYLSNILYKYLEVSILSNRDYIKYLNFCIENCKQMVYDNKDRLCSIIEDRQIINKIRSTKNIIESASGCTKNQCKFEDRILFIDNKFIVSK